MNSSSIPASIVCSAGGGALAIPPEIAAAKAAAIANTVAETEELPLLDAAGRVLAGVPRAVVSIPSFNNSAMDGYAIRARELTGDGPWMLPIAGRIAAGDSPATYDARLPAALRIFTGAILPLGFDTVVMQERCERRGDAVLISHRPRPGANVRLAGEDVHQGAALLHTGDMLTPQRLALLAGAGVDMANVFRKVRVALVSTGSELREPGNVLEPGQIYNSNRVLLRSMLAGCSWAEVHDFGIVADEPARLRAVIQRAAQLCDVIVTTGGVSAGDEDHVTAAVLDSGGSLEVMKVAMRPGKPVKIGLVGTTLFAGLPGNSNAALVTFRHIALPAIRMVAGLADIKPGWQPAISGFTYAKRLNRTEFVPVRINGRTEAGLPIVEMLGRGGSANLSAMASADGIAILPPDDEIIAPGTSLRLDMF